MPLIGLDLNGVNTLQAEIYLEYLSKPIQRDGKNAIVCLFSGKLTRIVRKDLPLMYEVALQVNHEVKFFCWTCIPIVVVRSKDVDK